MASDCVSLQLCPGVAINELKQLKGLRLLSIQARNGQHLGCSSSGSVCRSCCNSGHERGFTVIKADEFGFGSNTTWKTQQGRCRFNPLAKSPCKDEMMEEGGRKGAMESIQNCQSNRAKRTQSSTSSLIPGRASTFCVKCGIGWDSFVEDV